MNTCDHIRAQLLELPDPLIIPRELQQHLHSCAACQQFHDQLIDLQQQLTSLPEVDVSDEVFARTLAAVQQESSVKTSKRLNPQWATGLAASFVLVAVAGLLYNHQLGEYQPDFSQAPVDGVSVQTEIGQDNRAEASDDSADESPEAGFFADQEERQGNYDLMSAEDMVAKEQDQDGSSDLLRPNQSNHDSRFKGRRDVAQTAKDKQTGQVAAKPRHRETLEEARQQLPAQNARKINEYQPHEPGLIESTDQPKPAKREMMSLDELLKVVQRSAVEDEHVVREAQFSSRGEQEPKPVSQSAIEVAETERLNATDDERSKQKRAEKKNDANVPYMLDRQPLGDIVGVVSNNISQESEKSEKNNQPTAQAKPVPAPVSAIAGQWLAAQHNTADLTFKPASGYWANTYLPGDPGMRWIEARLLAAGLADLPATRAVSQPFDPPVNAALAMYVHSDQVGMDANGPARMRLQVGIQAGAHQGGHRTALNLAVVLDLTSKDREAEVRALLMELLKHKQPGDQISVYHTGRSGLKNSRLLGPEAFRHGPIQLMLDQWFSSSAAELELFWPVDQVLPEAWQWLADSDDPEAVLGSSALWLISDKASQEAAVMSHWVQQQATEGISFNTLSLHQTDPLNHLKQLALLGQGHHHVMAGSQDAERVVKAQLKAASQAVARALRLQIRLAEGVQLIDVIGSEPLNDRQTRAVKQAEQSLDQRMAANHGITADRGEDDEGIQIIIPGFYAGDAHVVLLDVLVNQPGVVADVSLRYKDLIHLRNSKISRQHVLSAGQQERGPLERNVLKNLVSAHFSQVFQQAAEQLRQGHHERAMGELQRLLNQYQGLRQRIPGWQQDAELLADEQLIRHYLSWLQTHSQQQPTAVQWLADAMQWTGWQKHPGHGP